MSVFVYKTNIKKNNYPSISEKLSVLLKHTKWNFDFEDCDNILRIETENLNIEKLYECLSSLGFECEELI